MDRLPHILQMLESQPEDAFLLYALAKEYEKRGEEEKALETFLKLRTLHPDYVGFYYHLGKLYERLGRADEAMATYEEGMQWCQKVGDQHAFSELQTAADGLTA